MKDDANQLLGLDQRARNCLRAEGLFTEHEVVNAYLRGYQFDKIPNCGKKTAIDIKEWAINKLPKNSRQMELEQEINVLKKILARLQKELFEERDKVGQ